MLQNGASPLPVDALDDGAAGGQKPQFSPALADVINHGVGPEALLPDAEAHPHLLYLIGADALKDRYVLHRGPPFAATMRRSRRPPMIV